MDGIGTPGGGAGGGIKHVGVMTMEPGSYHRLRDTSIRAGIMEEWLRFTYEFLRSGPLLHDLRVQVLPDRVDGMPPRTGGDDVHVAVVQLDHPAAVPPQPSVIGGY
jgi:hypothetical protein